MIQQVASSARQTLAAAKATSLQRCVRTQLRAGSHCLNPRLGAAATTTDHPSTTERRQTSENRLPAPAAARTLAEKTLARRRRARPRRRQRTRPPRHRNDPGREWCSTVATGAPNCHPSRRIVTRAATYITLLRTQRENIPLRDCVRSMAWKPCVQKDAVVCSMTASYDSRTCCPRPIHVALVYTSTLHTHKSTRDESVYQRRDPSSSALANPASPRGRPTRNSRRVRTGKISSEGIAR